MVHPHVAELLDIEQIRVSEAFRKDDAVRLYLLSNDWNQRAGKSICTIATWTLPGRHSATRVEIITMTIRLSATWRASRHRPFLHRNQTQHVRARRTSCGGRVAGGRRLFDHRYRDLRLDLAPRLRRGRLQRGAQCRALVRGDIGQASDRKGAGKA